MLASFHRGDPGPSHAEQAPDVVPADHLPDVEPWARFTDEWPDWDLRAVPEPDPGWQRFWFRHRGRLPDDDAVHQLGLAYLSDMTLLGVAHKRHRGDAAVQMASLDHALWFLQPARVDEWLLYDQRSPAGGHGRGLTEGRLFDTSGRLVAYVVQQGLMRYLR
ncbi:MAG: acyl-CoA thioesterase, partial [Mycobacteriales bacterium]